jgi:small-conductance mechanosensitive channel
MIRALVLLFCLAAIWPEAMGQEKDPVKTVPQVPAIDSAENSKVQALEGLLLSMRNEEEERNVQRELLKKAVTEEQKKNISAEIDRIDGKLKELRENFTTTATGINPNAGTADSDGKLSINDELRNIIQPMARELREATAQPREIENLTNELAQWRVRQNLAITALSQIDALLAEKNSAALSKELSTLRKSWQKQLQEAESRSANTKVQLEERKRNSPSVFNLLTNLISHFWKNRGLSLFLSLSGGLLAWYLGKRLYRELKKHSPMHKKHEVSFTTRLIDVAAHVLVVLLGLFTALLILYTRNDWLLLTASLILFIGMIWASRTALPPYFEQVRLILNLGNIRLGERVIINNLPWRVESLNFFCELRNPELTGGILRLPAKSLLNLYSRPSQQKEPWFPSKTDDWVKLDDGTLGKVVLQSPEQVQLVKLGGAFKSYPTNAYLTKNPENISNRFRVSSIFGLDYRHLPIATTEIPKVISNEILRVLDERYGREAIKSVNVEFASAAPSSLDFHLAADIDGGIASQHEVLQRLLQRIAVDCALENNWTIPFPQMTIHTCAQDAVATSHSTDP